MLAWLGAERPFDFSSGILDKIKHITRSEYIAFAFCLPLLLLLLAEVFSQAKWHTPFSDRSTHGSCLIATHIRIFLYKKSSSATLKQDFVQKWSDCQENYTIL